MQAATDGRPDPLVDEGPAPRYVAFGVVCTTGYAEVSVMRPPRPPLPCESGNLWDALRKGRLTQKNVGPETWDEFQRRERNSREACARRARKRIRLHNNTCQLDRLLTLTTREFANDPATLWRCWDLLRRALIRVRGGERFDFAAVIEDHPSNPEHRHIHLAVRGYQDANLVRSLWRSVLKGQGIAGGNVDVTRRRSTRKIGQYLAKYMAKDLGETGQSWREKGKRRYSVSRLELHRRPRRFRHNLDATTEADMERALRLMFDKLEGWLYPGAATRIELWACGRLAHAWADSS